MKAIVAFLQSSIITCSGRAGAMSRLGPLIEGLKGEGHSRILQTSIITCSGGAGGMSRLGPLLKGLKAVKLVHTQTIIITIVFKCLNCMIESISSIPNLIVPQTLAKTSHSNSVSSSNHPHLISRSTVLMIFIAEKV